jgi:hypothetical protein
MVDASQRYPIAERPIPIGGYWSADVATRNCLAQLGGWVNDTDVQQI